MSRAKSLIFIEAASIYMGAPTGGIRVPTRRRAYVRGPDGRPEADLLMVSIDRDEVAFS